jgi:hypothetical protein
MILSTKLIVDPGGNRRTGMVRTQIDEAMGDAGRP